MKKKFFNKFLIISFIFLLILELNVLSQTEETEHTIIEVGATDISYIGDFIPIIVVNKGIKDTKYELSVEGIDWYQLSKTNFMLKPNKKKIIDLVFYPDKNVIEGEYDIDIKLKADDKELIKPITVNLKIKKTFSEKINSFLHYYRYLFWLSVVFFIVILSLIFLLIKKKRRRKAEKNSFYLKNFMLLKFESIYPFLVIIFLLALLGYGISNFYSIKDFFLIYFPYILLGIGILLILILILHFRKKTY